MAHCNESILIRCIDESSLQQASWKIGPWSIGLRTDGSFIVTNGSLMANTMGPQSY